MTSLLVGLGTLAMVSFAVSALVSMTWCASNRILRLVTPAAEARLLLLIVVLPIAVASLSQLLYWEWPGGEHTEQAASGKLPSLRSGAVSSGARPTKPRISGLNTAAHAWGREGREHARRREAGHEWHEQHEHPREPSKTHSESVNREHVREYAREYAGKGEAGFPQAMLVMCVLLGGVLISRFVLMLRRMLLAIKTSMATSRSLRDLASAHPDGILVLPTPKPEAFVLGTIQPKLFASQGLLAMPQVIVRAVLAHERAHIRRLDPLRHLLVLMACTFHLPGISAYLQRRMQQAQELAADADAAHTLGDATGVAEALVCCARFRHDNGSPRLAFGGGDIEERVRTLLAERRTLDQPRPWLVGLLACMLVYVAVRYAEPAHHIIETLLTVSR